MGAVHRVVDTSDAILILVVGGLGEHRAGDPNKRRLMLWDVGYECGGRANYLPSPPGIHAWDRDARQKWPVCPVQWAESSAVIPPSIKIYALSQSKKRRKGSGSRFRLGGLGDDVFARAATAIRSRPFSSLTRAAN